MLFIRVPPGFIGWMGRRKNLIPNLKVPFMTAKRRYMEKTATLIVPKRENHESNQMK